jgi:hypothetical protein
MTLARWWLETPCLANVGDRKLKAIARGQLDRKYCEPGGNLQLHSNIIRMAPFNRDPSRWM